MLLFDKRITIQVSNAGIDSIDSADKVQDEEDDSNTYKNRHKHLVFFSLLDALLPDVELQVELFTTTDSTKGYNICHKSLIDTFQITDLHEEETLECLAEVH